MPEKVSILEDLKVIKIESWGDVNEKEMRVTLDEVLEIHKKRGYTKVFVDASKMDSMPTTLPMFQFGSDMAERVMSMKYAAFMSPKLLPDMDFLETVTRNRGMQVKMFNSEEAALEWLLAEPKTD